MKMNKRLLVTSAMMLTAVTVALSTNTYAWFTMANENKLSDFTIQAAAASGGLEISLDGKTFSSSSVAMTAEGVKALDVTSTDGQTFYKATLDSAGQNVKSLSQTSLAGIDYFETDLYFRTVAQGTIYLHQDSYVKCDDLTANTSSFGSFSRNYIAGAARLSFQVTGYQDSASKNQYESSSLESEKDPGTIIEPDNVVYTDDTKETVAYQVNNITLSQNKSTGAWSVDPNGSHTENVKQISNAASATFSSDDVETEGWSAKQEIVKITSTSPDFTFTENNIQITKVTLRIWIEGQDNEAKTPLTSGKFITGLKFGLNTQATAATQVAIKPTNVHMTDGVITWNPVLGAKQYAIYKNSDATPVDTVAHPTASYTVSNYVSTDKYYVQAIAKTDGSYASYYKDGAKVEATVTAA